MFFVHTYCIIFICVYIIHTYFTFMHPCAFTRIDTCVCLCVCALCIPQVSYSCIYTRKCWYIYRVIHTCICTHEHTYIHVFILYITCIQYIDIYIYIAFPSWNFICSDQILQAVLRCLCIVSKLLSGVRRVIRLIYDGLCVYKRLPLQGMP